jgi:hypothetical protein
MNAIIDPKVILDPAAIAQKAKALGHLAVHCRSNEGRLAARFFEVLGCRIKEYGPFPDGQYFHIIALNSEAPDEPSDIVFLSTMQPEQAELERAVSQFLGLGTSSPHPIVRAFEAKKVQMPEFFLHLGIHYASLEDLEAATVRLKDEIKNNPEFGKRFQGVQVLRAIPGRDQEIDARMAASKVFSNADLDAYGANIVQIHIRTDIVSMGLGFMGAVVELDYAFRGKGREHNPFNSMEMAQGN